MLKSIHSLSHSESKRRYIPSKNLTVKKGQVTGFLSKKSAYQSSVIYIVTKFALSLVHNLSSHLFS